MIHAYTYNTQAEAWLQRYRGTKPIFACVLGFTETCLIPGISAAGRTPNDRKYTACADAEYLYYGPEYQPQYPLPPLHAGASPVLISRAVVEKLELPLYLFNAGLPQTPSVPFIDLGGKPANCLSQGAAMEQATVQHLLEQGLLWGDAIAKQADNSYLILSECVVGGTTTALAILTGLGIEAAGKVNSSHPTCNHEQKWAVVRAGLNKIRGVGSREWGMGGTSSFFPTPHSPLPIPPLSLVAAVGDPMQIAVAGMTLAASRRCGVLLAGGTQMLAVYALTNAIAQFMRIEWNPKAVVVGTTRWVAVDPTGKTVELAELISQGNSPTISLLATELSFANSRYPQLQAYEQGFVKEGVGAGGACIAAHLSQNWQQNQLLDAIEEQLQRLSLSSKFTS